MQQICEALLKLNVDFIANVKEKVKTIDIMANALKHKCIYLKHLVIKTFALTTPEGI